MADLKARATLDPSAFHAGLKSIEDGAASLQQQLSQVGRRIAAGFTVGALVRTGREVIALGSQITDLATQTGLSTDQFQAFGLAVRDAGGSEEQLVTMMARLRDAQAKVIDGSEKEIETFRRLGMSQEQVIRSDTAQLLEAVARGFAKAGTNGAAFGATMDLLGVRNAPKLTEALQVLARDGFGGLEESARDAGLMTDKYLLQRLDALNDKLGRTKRKIMIFFGDIADRAATGIQQVAAFYGAVSAEGFTIMDPRKRLQIGFNAMSDVERERTGAVRDRSAEEAARRVAEAAEAASRKAEAAEQKKASTVEKLTERVANLQQKADFDRLSRLGQIADLERRLVDLTREAAQAGAGADAEIKRLEATEKLIRAQEDLRRLTEAADKDRWDEEARIYAMNRRASEAAARDEQDMANAGKGITVKQEASDRLASIGGFGSDFVSPLARVAERQVELLQRIQAIQERSYDRLGQIGQAGGYV